MTAKLPAGWTVDEEPEAALPPGWSVVEEKPSAAHDVISEEMRAKGFEPEAEEEFERAAELGTAEATRGVLSGLTFGLSENVPGLKTEENIASTTGKAVGSVLPISKLINFFTGPIVKLAVKSPIFAKQLGALGNLIGVGTGMAAHKGLEDISKGEIPSPEDLLEHGLEWAALDAALQTLGAGGRFATSLIKRARASGKPGYGVLKNTLAEVEASGLTEPEQITKKALEILERPLTPAEEAAGRELALRPKPEPGTIEKTAQEALKQPEVTPKDLKTRKVNQDAINRLNTEVQVLAEPYQPEEVNFSKEAEALENTAIEEQIEQVGSRAASEQELGTAIREDIETNLENAKKEYAPLYREAETRAEAIIENPKTAVKKTGNKLKEFERLKHTRPKEYAASIKEMENILGDLGYEVQRAEDGAIQDIIQTRDVSVADQIELGKRIGHLVDYEAIDPTVKNVLKSIRHDLKADIKSALKADPEALAAYELAEAEHARVAQKFGRDSVRRIRQNEAGEKVAAGITSPTTFEDLKSVLSPKQLSQVEREFLEKLNNQTFEKGQKTLREMERHLTAENRKLARDIVEAKNPHNPAARKRITQQALLTDMSNAFTNGTRPEKALNLWKTAKGQKLVKEAFHNSPNWPSVKSYLEKQSFNDMISSVLKDGKIDPKRLKDFLKDPALMNDIRAMGGEEAVTFFRHLDSQMKQIEANIKLLDHLPNPREIGRGKELLEQAGKRAAIKPKAEEMGQKVLKPGEKAEKAHVEAQRQRGSRILQRMKEKDFSIQAKTQKWKDWFKDTMGINEKGFLSVFGLMKLGLPNTVATLMGYKVMTRMATNPAVRKAVRDAAKHYIDPVAFIVAMEHLDDLLGQEE